MTSDHFHPWWHDNGYGNFTWVWMAAAAAERTNNMKFITGVTAAVYRYNPAIIAQAFASLDVLYPGRIGLGIGTGEAMNEVPAGFDWPSADIRLARATEAIRIISRLWKQGRTTTPKGEDNNEDHNGFVEFDGEYFKIKNAKLYTPHSGKIPLYMAAVGEQATKTAAKHTDSLITLTKPDQSKEIFDIFDKAAIKEGKDQNSLEKIAKPKLSYSEDYDKALKSSEFWRNSLLEGVFNLNISDPRELEQKAKDEVSDEKLRQSVFCWK
ncbi:MAG: LLM class flavin-dependent oxidoreductase [Nitrososphaeraceae archaeon]